MPSSLSTLFGCVIPLTFLYGAANFVIAQVILFDKNLLKNPTYRLMLYLAMQEILTCAVSTCGWIMAFISCVQFPYLEQNLYLSSSYCNLFGGLVIITAISAVYGQFILAFNRFAAVFFWLRYKRLFSRRNCKIIWVVIVCGIPLAFFVPSMAGAVGSFVSYPGYCICVPFFYSEGKVWGSMVTLLTVAPVALSLLMYLAIFFKIHVMSAQRQLTTTQTDTGTSAALALAVRRRARNSLAFFILLVIYLVCVSQSAFVVTGEWQFDKVGTLPMISMQFSVTQWGISLVVYIALNKVFRVTFVRWLRSSWFASRWFGAPATSTSDSVQDPAPAAAVAIQMMPTGFVAAPASASAFMRIVKVRQKSDRGPMQVTSNLSTAAPVETD